MPYHQKIHSNVVGLKGTAAKVMKNIYYEIILTAQSRTTRYAFESKEERAAFSSTLFGVQSFSENVAVKDDCGWFFGCFDGKYSGLNDAFEHNRCDFVTWYLDAGGRLFIIDQNNVEYNLGKPDSFNTDHYYSMGADHFIMEASCYGQYNIIVEHILPDEED